MKHSRYPSALFLFTPCHPAPPPPRQFPSLWPTIPPSALIQWFMLSPVPPLLSLSLVQELANRHAQGSKFLKLLNTIIYCMCVWVLMCVSNMSMHMSVCMSGSANTSMCVSVCVNTSIMCAWVCVCLCGIDSLLLPCEFWGSSSGHLVGSRCFTLRALSSPELLAFGEIAWEAGASFLADTGVKAAET